MKRAKEGWADVSRTELVSLKSPTEQSFGITGFIGTKTHETGGGVGTKLMETLPCCILPCQSSACFPLPNLHFWSGPSCLSTPKSLRPMGLLTTQWKSWELFHSSITFIESLHSSTPPSFSNLCLLLPSSPWWPAMTEACGNRSVCSGRQALLQG